MTLKTDLKEFPASLREKLYNDVCDCLEGHHRRKDAGNTVFRFVQQPVLASCRGDGDALPVRAGGVSRNTMEVVRQGSAAGVRADDPACRREITNGKTFRLFGSKREMDSLAYLRLLDAIHNRLRTLRLPYAGSFVRTSSVTDHDHDALVVSAETYSVLCNDISGVFPAAKVARKAFDVKISK